MEARIENSKETISIKKKQSKGLNKANIQGRKERVVVYIPIFQPDEPLVAIKEETPIFKLDGTSVVVKKESPNVENNSLQQDQLFGVKKEDKQVCSSLTEPNTPTVESKSSKDVFRYYNNAYVKDGHGSKCSICKKTFTTQYYCRKHVRDVHLNNPPPSRTRRIRLNTTTPNIDDPNDYRQTCNYYYSTKTNFRRHLREFHKMELEPSPKGFAKHYCKSPRVRNTNDEFNYICRNCNIEFSNKQSYQTHLNDTHSISVEPGECIKLSNVVRIFDDPNYYCRVCNHRYASRQSFRRRLVSVHEIDPWTESHPKSVRSCQICNRRFLYHFTYKKHLRNSHSNIYAFPQIPTIPKSDVLPIVDDPNFYCRSCDRYYSKKENYRIHLLSIHNIITPTGQEHKMILLNNIIPKPVPKQHRFKLPTTPSTFGNSKRQ